MLIQKLTNTSEIVTPEADYIENPFDFLSSEVSFLVWQHDRSPVSQKITAILEVENSGEIPRKSLLSRPDKYYGRD